MGAKPRHQLKEDAVPWIFTHFGRKRQRPFHRKGKQAKKQVNKILSLKLVLKQIIGNRNFTTFTKICNIKFSKTSMKHLLLKNVNEWKFFDSIDWQKKS